MSTNPIITASTITSLLSAKHSDDLFIPECKTGSTYIGSHSRMDGLAIKKSYAKPLITAYEIKVSRSDFINDEKWTSYLDYCNSFYFVCPVGLISVSEVPEEAGLIYVSKTGTKLFNKKKAPYRKVDIPESLWRYILYSRTKIIREYDNDKEDRSKRIEDYLKQKDYYKSISYMMSTKIRQKINEVEKENKDLKIENKVLQEFKETLNTIGISLQDLKYRGTWNLENKIKEILSVVPQDLMKTLDKSILALTQTRDNLEKIKANEFLS